MCFVRLCQTDLLLALSVLRLVFSFAVGFLGTAEEARKRARTALRTYLSLMFVVFFENDARAHAGWVKVWRK